MDNILQTTFLNNTVLQWIIAAGIIAAAIILLKIVKFYVIKRLKKWALRTVTTWDNFILEIIEKSVLPMLYISAVYFSLLTLKFNPTADKIIHIAYLVSITFFVLKIISAAFKKFVYSFIDHGEDSESKLKQAGGLIAIINIIIWMCGIIFLIDNLGYNVTTLIAGLGVGGIAIALAAQAVLGDLFSYFVIFFDRPFEIGDFVTLNNDNGIIEYIGIKTTRIRTLSGEQLICSNTDLTNSRLRNYKRMERRRIVFSLGVTYQTTHSQLAKIPGMVKEIIESKPQLQFDRGHFSGYGDSSLNFEFVYYVTDPDYNTYMDNQQAVYLDIFAAFEKESIDFAYPTQTIIMDKSSELKLTGINQQPTD
ncbi:mechanosensitive ion channel family protein [Flavobacterium sp. MFBS3-15]|uniref:mechanosensitive ion channel family protein n=1 Tax=Flavobacterium sp. MFBS3-15 TaxID=2989816 RepID=UPI002236125C|nr:mechanosensitive ion channel family protein [Flavobacterium sp. MFBS3-15]MCW4467713.1 mechanosensitive ion channel family protein [Flavobacterium sp. MFBS3-15]